MAETIIVTAYNFKSYSSEPGFKYRIEDSMLDFKQRLFEMYLTETQEKRPHIKTPWRYEEFKGFGDRITYNPKLELFTRFIPCHDLRAYCEIPMNGLDIPIDESWPKGCLSKFNKDVSCLFGPGEFPHMTFHIIELPDAPYCFYTIHR